MEVCVLQPIILRLGTCAHALLSLEAVDVKLRLHLKLQHYHTQLQPHVGLQPIQPFSYTAL